MLRLKLLLPLFVVVPIATLTVFFLWLPGFERQIREEYLQEEREHLAIVATALTEPLLQGDLARVQLILDDVVRNKSDWTLARLHDTQGRPLYLSNPVLQASLPAGAGHLALQQGIWNHDVQLAELDVDFDLSHTRAIETRLVNSMLVLVAGLIALSALVAFPLLDRTLRRPVSQLAQAARAMSQGDFNAPLPPKAGDEIGQLAASFDRMRDDIRSYQGELHQALQDSRQSALKVARQYTLLGVIAEVQGMYIDDAAPASLFEAALGKLIALTDSEFGFIGEVRRDEAGPPYLHTLALSNVAWDEASRALYEQSLAGNMEFHKIKTLFGAVLETGEPVIANHPATDPRRGGLPPGHPPLDTFLGVPLQVKHRMVGMIGLANRPDGYSHELLEDFAPLFQAIAQLMEGFRHEQERQRAEQALRSSEALLAHLAKESPSVIYSTQPSPPYALMFITENVGRICGYTPADFTADPQRRLDNIHPEDRERVLQAMQALPEQEHISLEYRIRAKEGGYRWVLDGLRLIRDEAGHPVEIIGAMRDISELKQTQEKLVQAAVVFDNSAEGIIIADAERRITAVNHAFTKITGYSEAEALGRNPGFMKSGRHDHAFYEALWATLNQTGQWQGEIWNLRKNGEAFPEHISISAVRDEAGTIRHYIGVFSDLSAIKRSEADLDFLAHHDPLTGLPNRSLLQDRIGRAIQRARRRGQMVAVMVLDLDRFKNINDSLGHALGDKLLQAVARRFEKLARQEDTVARLGGDDFVVVMELDELPAVSVFAQKLLHSIQQPFQVDGHELHLSLSIGISLFPNDGSDPQALLQHADAAMYRAKEVGRNGYQFYTQELSLAAAERLSLETGLRHALADNQMRLHYQPQFCLKTGALIGAETLLRWSHPKLGQVPPDRFIPVAEESGLILPIGEWVLRNACAQMRAWLDAGLPIGRISVNVAGPQIQRGDILASVRAALDDSGLAPSLLEIEVTETFIMHEPAQAITTLDALRDMGVMIAIDDFGTGYSSLSHLSRLPVTKLKIDKSFVQDIANGSEGEAITRAVIALGKSLGQTVIAEGVETEAQADFLRAEGCDEVQGYLFGRPMPAEEFARLCTRPGD